MIRALSVGISTKKKQPAIDSRLNYYFILILFPKKIKQQLLILFLKAVHA